MKNIALASAAVAALTISAQAADLPAPAPITPLAPAAFDWSGFYLGLNGGYLWGDSLVFDADNPSDNSGSFSMDGFIGGVQGGFNYQTGNWVWGAEADIQYSDANGTTCAGQCAAELRWFGTLRARGGYAFDRTLLYATGGLAYGGTDTRGSIGDNFSETEVGWTLGGGIEHAFTENWTAKAEYLYMDLGDSVSSSFGVGGAYDDNHIVRVGINYLFK